MCVYVCVCVCKHTLASKMLFPRERSLLCLERLAIWETRADLSLTAIYRPVCMGGGGEGGGWRVEG